MTINPFIQRLFCLTDINFSVKRIVYFVNVNQAHTKLSWPEIADETGVAAPLPQAK